MSHGNTSKELSALSWIIFFRQGAWVEQTCSSTVLRGLAEMSSDLSPQTWLDLQHTSLPLREAIRLQSHDALWQCYPHCAELWAKAFPANPCLAQQQMAFPSSNNPAQRFFWKLRQKKTGELAHHKPQRSCETLSGGKFFWACIFGIAGGICFYVHLLFSTDKLIYLAEKHAKEEFWKRKHCSFMNQETAWRNVK